jgi:hypothetical protein
MSFLFFGALGLAPGCGDDAPAADAGIDAQEGWARWPDLPEAQSNNAVAAVQTEGGCMIYSLLGIDSSLSSTGVHNRGFRLREGDAEWSILPPVPGPGRVAASAVGIAGQPYVLGGYSIAGDGTETTHDLLQRFNLQTGQWNSLAPLPVAIDDAVAAAWRDRYIVVVSGWHDAGNVADVQIYDSQSDQWIAATSFPGTPVFGHSGSISGDRLLVVDGVRSSFGGFTLVNQAWLGELDPQAPEVITWTDLGQHPGPARYRAAGGAAPDGRIWIHGGTSEPYNYDGLRYDSGEPATPLATTLIFDPQARSFDEMGADPKPTATMDHRSLVLCGGQLVTAGGMQEGPSASAQVWTIAP